MVVQQHFLSQALPANRMRTATTNTGFPTGNPLIVGSNSGGNLFLNNHQPRTSSSSSSYSNPAASHLKSHHQYGSQPPYHHQLNSYMMSHLINPEAHGFATPPPSVLPSVQNTPTDGQTQPQFMTPTSTTSLFGCQQVPELNHTRAVHSPAITPPEHAASLDAKLLSGGAVSSSSTTATTNGTTHSTSQQAALNAFRQMMASSAASGQINGGGNTVNAALALNQLLSNPAVAATMAQNPMLLAAMSALNNGANWQHPSVLQALYSILDPQGFAAIQAALIQEAQRSQQMHLLAQLQQHHQLAAALAMNQDQISIEKAAAAAAMHQNGDPRLISHPQWMSPPLSSNTPASSSSPLVFSGDELSNTGATAGTSNVPSSGSSGLEENSSPAPRGDVVFSPERQRLSSFDTLADYNRWDCDDVQRILTEQSGLSEKESIAVAVLAGLASNR